MTTTKRADTDITRYYKIPRLDKIKRFEKIPRFNKIFSQFTPALSHDQVLKKGTSKRSMNSEPFRPTDTGKHCQNLKTLGKTDFLPKKWVKKT